MTIVRHVHRYRPPPRKQRKAMALELPTIVTPKQRSMRLPEMPQAANDAAAAPAGDRAGKPREVPRSDARRAAAGRVWRNETLPSPVEGPVPLSAFPAWFLHGMRAVRARALRHRGASAHWHDATLREIVVRLHHEHCGGRPKLVELMTGIDGGSVPVRRIRLLG